MKKMDCVSLSFFSKINLRLKKEYIALSAYIIICIVLEVLAYVGPWIFSWLASRFWFVTAILCLGYFCYILIYEIKNDILNKRILFLGMSILLFAYLLFFVLSDRYSTISYESCLQLGAGYKAYLREDFGYTLTAFLGYPLRQYVIAALPGKLFGNSILTLRMGYGIPFFIGVFSLLIEYKKKLEQNNTHEIYAVIFVLFILSFRFVSEFFSIFEQTLLPVSLAMISTALYLSVRREAGCFKIICLSWTGCMMMTSYTPSLATAGLLMVFLMLDFLKEIKANGKETLHTTYITYPLICVQMSIYWLLTVTNKYAARQKIGAQNVEGGYIKHFYTIVSEFFMDKNGVFFGVYTGIILLYLILSLVLCLEYYNFLIAVWSICVSIASIFAVGYIEYAGPILKYHRNLIMIPIIVTGIFMFVLPYLHKIKYRRIILLTIVGLFGLSFYHFTLPYQCATFLNAFEPCKYMISGLTEIVKENDISFEEEFNIYARLEPDDIGLKNLRDFTEFLYPNASVINVADGLTIKDVEVEGKGIYISRYEEFFDEIGVIPTSKEYHNYKVHQDNILFGAYREI